MDALASPAEAARLGPSAQAALLAAAELPEEGDAAAAELPEEDHAAAEA